MAAIACYKEKLCQVHAQHWKTLDTGAGRSASQLASQNTPTRVAGLKLGRTENAVRSKASELGISLRPTNQSPYGRRR
jgi:hypothetical protein